MPSWKDHCQLQIENFHEVKETVTPPSSCFFGSFQPANLSTRPVPLVPKQSNLISKPARKPTPSLPLSLFRVPGSLGFMLDIRICSNRRSSIHNIHNNSSNSSGNWMEKESHENGTEGSQKHVYLRRPLGHMITAKVAIPRASLRDSDSATRTPP